MTATIWSLRRYRRIVEVALLILAVFIALDGGFGENSDLLDLFPVEKPQPSNLLRKQPLSR